MTRVSVIDIGTQSVLHLIAERESGRLRTIRQRTAAVRLGEGLAGTGSIGAEPLQRLLSILTEYKEEAQSAGSGRITAVGTRVFRAAINRGQIIRTVAGRTGLDIEVLSEEQEARYGYLGATRGASYGGTVTVVDIGGGSTEIIQGEGTGIRGWRSVPAGAVTCTEMQCGERDMPAFFAGCDDLLQSSRLAGIGGTITTLAALDLGLEQYDPDAVDGHVLAAGTIMEMKRKLAGMHHRERQAWITVDPDRADILPAGAMILSWLLSRSRCRTISVRDRGLRFGIALRELGMI